jgi:hypothetical protein
MVDQMVDRKDYPLRRRRPGDSLKEPQILDSIATSPPLLPRRTPSKGPRSTLGPSLVLPLKRLLGLAPHSPVRWLCIYCEAAAFTQ